MLACTAIALAQSQNYTDTTNDWQMTLPPGWETLDSRELAEHNARAADRARDLGVPEVTYSVVLRPRQANGQYCAVQLLAPFPPGVSATEFQANLPKIMSNAASKVNNMTQQERLVGPSSTSFDVERRQLRVAESAGSDVNPEEMQISYFCFGANCSVVIHCYAPTEDSVTAASTFDAMVQTHAFGPNSVYQYGTGALNTGNWDRRVQRIVIASIVGGVAAVAFGFIRRLLGR